MNFITEVINFLYYIFWDEKFITLTLPGNFTMGIPLLALLLIPMGIYFTIKTKCLIVRYFPEMLRITIDKKASGDKNSLSGLQALIVSTATRVGMGNLVGVVAAISAGGAGAVFWMWVTAILGSATAYVEAVLAQLYKEKDPLYGGFRGGPAYYIHGLFSKKGKKSVIAILFAVSALICWGGVSQVIGNSVSSSFSTTFNIPTLYTTIALVLICAVIVMRKNATVKVLDVIVPVMAAVYFIITIVIIAINITQIPAIFDRIFSEAFGLRQAAGGALGAVISKGAQRGLFSNEAGSGSAPCAAAAADTDNPVKSGLLQSFGVFIDTIVICTCTAMLILIANPPQNSDPMIMLNNAMNIHMGYFGQVFVTVILALFCISTFLGILFYARSNIAYIFGDNWTSQSLYKVFALCMLFVGGIAKVDSVWALADVGIALMTIFNLTALLPLSYKPLSLLKDYTKK
ncbi:MAG: alanine/glycine:cation symporter family protein [Clostridia bacterium]